MDGIAWLATLGVGCAGIGAWGLWERAALRRRVHRALFSGHRAHGSPLDRWLDGLDRLPPVQWLGRELGRAYWNVSPRAFCGTLVALVAALWVLLHKLLPVDIWLALSLAAIIVHTGAVQIIRRRQAQLVRAFDEQLAPATRILADSLRAGRSTYQAVGDVAEQVRSALVGQAFRQLSRNLELHASLDEAFTALCDRIASRELRWLRTTLLTLHQVGGDAAGVMERMSHKLTERAQVRQEVLAASQKSRGAAWMVTGMGFGFILALGALFPGIFTVFLTPWGAALLGAYCLIQYSIWKLTAAVTRFDG